MMNTYNKILLKSCYLDYKWSHKILHFHDHAFI